MKDKIARIVAVAAMAALACLALTGCDAAGMDREATNKLGLALGIAIVLASWLGMRLSGRHFARKRQDAKRKNSKKRRR